MEKKKCTVYWALCTVYTVFSVLCLVVYFVLGAIALFNVFFALNIVSYSCIPSLDRHKDVMQGKLIAVVYTLRTHWNQNISLIFLCERWIPCQALTSVLCLHYCPERVHCSTKDVYTYEITFLALHPWDIKRLWPIHTVKISNMQYAFRVQVYEDGEVLFL